MCVDMCVDKCVDMCVDMREDMCEDMRVDMHVRAWTRGDVDMCVDTEWQAIAVSVCYVCV